MRFCKSLRSWKHTIFLIIQKAFYVHYFYGVKVFFFRLLLPYGLRIRELFLFSFFLGYMLQTWTIFYTEKWYKSTPTNFTVFLNHVLKSPLCIVKLFDSSTSVYYKTLWIINNFGIVLYLKLR